MGPTNDNDPIVTVQTPDGRLVQLRQSVAANFSGSLLPVASASVPMSAPTIANTNGAAGIIPQPSSPPQTMAAIANSATRSQTPDTAPDEPRRRRDGLPAFTAAESDQVGAARTPAVGPSSYTTEQLRKMGPADSLNRAQDAMRQGEAAGQQKADLDAAFLDAKAAAEHTQNEKIDALYQQRADEIADQQKQLQDRVNSYDAAVKQYGDFKIDRSIAHPIIAALGLALSAVGAAWANKSENPAMTALMAQIKNNVDDQIHQHDALGNVVNQKKTGIDIIRQQASDRTAQYNLAIAGEIERTKHIGDDLVARSASAQVKANWAIQRAALEKEQATAVGTAVDQQHGADRQDKLFAEQQRHSKAEEGLAGWGHAIEMKKFTYQKEKDEKDRQLAYDNLAERGMKDELSALKTAGKAAAENGVFNPTSGTLLLQPEGEKAVKEADSLDGVAQNFRAAASTTADQNKRAQLLTNADAYEKKAALTREQAKAEHAFTIQNKEEGAKMREAVAAGQKMSTVISSVRAGLRDGSIFDRNAMARLSTLYGEAKATFGHSMGARFNEKEFETLDQILGGDPSDWKNIADVKLGRTSARLDAALESTADNVTAELKAHGYRGRWKPDRVDDEKLAATPQEQAKGAVFEATTPTESAEGAKPGGARSALQGDWSPVQPLGMNVGKLMGARDNDDLVAKMNQEQSQSNYGLLPEQQQHIDMLIKGAKPGPDGEKARAAVLDLVKSERSSIANAVLNQLREERPALYEQAVRQLPVDQRQQRERSAALPSSDPRDQALTIVMAQTPIKDLAQAAIAGDQGSKQELYRRMAMGDRSAQTAVAQLVQSIGGR